MSFELALYRPQAHSRETAVSTATYRTPVCLESMNTRVPFDEDYVMLVATSGLAFPSPMW